MGDEDEDGEGGEGEAGAGVGAVVKPPDQEIQIPVLPGPTKEAEVMVSRLPNILGIKTEAFDPNTFQEEEEADEFKFTTNIIRWRYKTGPLGEVVLDERGLPEWESNTRLVK
ncbi:unnamed protein product, partial [Discosporangium mesarthrocarpum]